MEDYHLKNVESGYAEVYRGSKYLGRVKRRNRTEVWQEGNGDMRHRDYVEWDAFQMIYDDYGYENGELEVRYAYQTRREAVEAVAGAL